MEKSIFDRLWAFIKAVHTTYIRQAIAGAGLVGCSVYPLWFNHIPPELIHTWVGIWAWVKTILSAYLGSYFAALGAHHVELKKNKKDGKSSQKKSQNGKAA